MFLFDLPQLTVPAATPEGLAVRQQNERYAALLKDDNRSLEDDGTQMKQIVMTDHDTYMEKIVKKSRGTFVNNWVMYDDLMNLNKETKTISVCQFLEYFADLFEAEKITTFVEIRFTDETKIYHISNSIPKNFL